MDGLAPPVSPPILRPLVAIDSNFRVLHLSPLRLFDSARHLDLFALQRWPSWFWLLGWVGDEFTSSPSSLALGLAFRVLPERPCQPSLGAASNASFVPTTLPWRFWLPSTFSVMASDLHQGSIPGCAASSGFLSLSTL
jgi:hypothetical protein